MSDDVLFRLIQELEELSVARGQLLARIEMLLSVQRERRPDVVTPQLSSSAQRRTGTVRAEIEQLFETDPQVRSVEQVVTALREQGVKTQSGTVRVLLHDLVKEGKMAKPERGRYTLAHVNGQEI